MDNMFYCKGRQLADYLAKNGSRFLEVQTDKGVIVYVFEFDDTIDINLKKWELDRKKWLF